MFVVGSSEPTHVVRIRGIEEAENEADACCQAGYPRIKRYQASLPLPGLCSRGHASSPRLGVTGISQLTICGFKPANVLRRGLAAADAMQYSFFVRN